MTSNKRRVGIELEFQGLSPAETAEIVAKELNGETNKKTDDILEVQTELGTFVCETDAKFIKRLSQASKENQMNNDVDYEGWFKSVLESASKELVPTELVCPPIQVNEINQISKLHNKLSLAGAKGSSDSFRFAFGAQLNPEITDIKVEKILNEFRSFLILSDWLKSQIQIDPTRILTSFASDFPNDYQLLIFDKNYKPGMSRLIEDYLKYNPTRNRSCDMLPLFMHIDKERVLSKVDDELVKPRPTYHYRLPNCQLSMKSWNIEVEWKRWLLIEKIAVSEFFDDLCDLHLQSLSKVIDFDSNTRMIELNNYVERVRT